MRKKIRYMPPREKIRLRQGRFGRWTAWRGDIFAHADTAQRAYRLLIKCEVDAMINGLGIFELKTSRDVIKWLRTGKWPTPAYSGVQAVPGEMVDITRHLMTSKLQH